MSDSPLAPASRFAAFTLGFLGFVFFAVMAVIVVGANRGKGTEFEDSLAAERRSWASQAKQAQASSFETRWLDQDGGIARISPPEFISIAGSRMLSQENRARPLEDDSFAVPGSETFQEIAARQMAEAENRTEEEQPDEDSNEEEAGDPADDAEAQESDGEEEEDHNANGENA